MRPVSGKRIMASAQRGFRREVKAEFRRVADQIGGLLLRMAGLDDRIPIQQEAYVRRAAREAVERMFISPDGSGPFAEDGETALAPYPQLLNKYYIQVVAQTVRSHEAWMRRNLPEDVFAYLETARSRPAVVAEAANPYLRYEGQSDRQFLTRLQSLRIFAPNPQAELDPLRRWVPMHRWTDRRGYRLSDRIWDTSDRTRQQIDGLVREAIREGMSATRLAGLVERFLNPDAAKIRTNRPYGTDASYSAMRLARTEISRAANQAAYISSYLNPYVERIEVARSGNGDPNCKVCPQRATLGMSGERLRAPYSIHSANIPPYHPHCMCHVRPVLTDNPQAVTQRLRAVIEDERSENLVPVTTPAQADNLIEQLLGQVLWTQLELGI